jgi:hypothetical protein
MPTTTMKDMIIAPLLELQANVHRETGRRCRVAVTLERAAYESLAVELGATITAIENGEMELHHGLTIRRGALVLVSGELEMR